MPFGDSSPTLVTTSSPIAHGVVLRHSPRDVVPHSNTPRLCVFLSLRQSYAYDCHTILHASPLSESFLLVRLNQQKHSFQLSADPVCSENSTPSHSLWVGLWTRLLAIDLPPVPNLQRPWPRLQATASLFCLFSDLHRRHQLSLDFFLLLTFSAA